LDFLKLFVNMRLALSFAGKQKSYFLDLRIKSYGCLKFQEEVWAGRACAVANQQELTTCRKSGGQEEKTFQGKWELPHKFRCRPAAGGRPLVAGLPATCGRGPVARPRPGPDRWSPVARRPEVAVCQSAAQGRPPTSGRLPAAGRHLRLRDSSNFLEIFLLKKKRIFGSLGDGPGLLGEWVYSTPVF
jgi:hypothetical protein